MGDISSVLKMTRIIVIRTPIYLESIPLVNRHRALFILTQKSCHEEINTSDFALNTERRVVAFESNYLLQNARNLNTSPTASVSSLKINIILTF